MSESYLVGSKVLIPIDFEVTVGPPVTVDQVEVSAIDIDASVEGATWTPADEVADTIGYGLGFTGPHTLPVGAYRIIARITANPEASLQDVGFVYVTEPQPAVNRGAAPPDYGTPIGQVRQLIGDTQPTDIAGGEGTYLWQSDAEIAGLLTVYSDPRRAAIFILRMVAMTPAMQYKKWSSADLSVDGPAITTALRGLIADIEKAISTGDSVEASAFFEVINMGTAVAQPGAYDWFNARRGSHLPFDVDYSLPRL